MRKSAFHNTAGFGILELLAVMAIIGVLAAIGIPNFFSARNRAQDRAAETYAASVYKVAFAFISEDATNAVVTDSDCTDGYIAGGFDVEPPGGVVTGCEVTVSPLGTPQVEVMSVNGRSTILSE